MMNHFLKAPRHIWQKAARSFTDLLRRRWKLIFISISAPLIFLSAILLWPMDTSHFLAAEPSGELLDRAGKPLYAYLNARQQWCFEAELDAVSPRLIQATLAAEDRRFYHHVGVDPLAVARAAIQNLTRRRVVSGASTLSMQVVKLAGHPSRSLGGKLRQAAQALRLERRVSKREILQAYLDHAPYGLNLVGCEAASRRYFGKPARELTLAEAALLAALPRSPSRLMPLAHPGLALRGRNRVLGRMREEGLISEAERQRAAAAPLGVSWHAFPRLAPHLAQRMRPCVMQGRASARTTLDRELQMAAEGLVRDYLKQFGGEIQNAAVIVVDVPSASARAWVGSGDFFSSQLGHQMDSTRARRSPGSTLKPFIYALGLERNCLYPSEVLLDGSLDLGSYNPKNFDQHYHGLIPAANALRQSLNVPAVMALGRVGQPVVYNFLKSAGLTTLRRPAGHYGLGLAVGNCEARLDELCAAYCMLASLGQSRPLAVRPGSTPPPARSLLSRGTALALYEMLEQPLPNELDTAALGTVRAAPRVCWKTGTSTGNHDAWAVVFNSRHLVGVWMGNPDGRPSRRLVGARAALPLAARVFRRLGSPSAADWPNPGGDLQNVEVCAVSGLPRSGWCPHTRLARLPRRQYLNRLCDVHWPEGEVQGNAHPRVAERWPGSAKGWDLARITAPVTFGRPNEPPNESNEPSEAAGLVHALQILNPPNAAKFIMTREAQGDCIRLRASIDRESPVHWYLNGRFLATSQPEKPVLLNLKPGQHRLVCMTTEGVTAQVRFQVQDPAAPVNFKDTR